MKPVSPLSLLLFLSLASGAPMPSEYLLNCPHDALCKQILRPALDATPGMNGHTPTTRLSSPHFPAHQLHRESSSQESHRQVEEEAFDNAPLSPKNQPPTIALSAKKPLQSSYLLTLSNPALKNPPQGEPRSTSTPSSEALPAKPTSALPKLREEDSLRYWESMDRESAVVEPKVVHVTLASETPRGCSRYGKLAESAYIRVGQPVIMAREYSDLLVVGIVVLFLAAVIVMEAVEYLWALKAAISGSRYWRRQRRGEIFLEDDENVSFVIKKPFCLQPPPPAKYKSSLMAVTEEDLKSQKEAPYHD